MSEAEWHTYAADDPSWEEDLGLVTEFQASHGLPQLPSSRPRQVAFQVPRTPAVIPEVTHASSPPLASASSSGPTLPHSAQLPSLRRITCQTRDAVLTPGLLYV